MSKKRSTVVIINIRDLDALRKWICGDGHRTIETGCREQLYDCHVAPTMTWS
jgi:hypothetical protein